MIKNKKEEKNIRKARQKYLQIKRIENELAYGNFKALECFIRDKSQDKLNYALEWACFYGKNDLVQQLINNGADVHSNNEIAIKIATQKNHLETVKCLVENGADINIADSPPLIDAVENGNLEIIKFFIEKNCDIHIQFDGALRMAIEKNQVKIAKLLIDYGANIHIFDDYLFDYVKEHGDLEMKKIFEI